MARESPLVCDHTHFPDLWHPHDLTAEFTEADRRGVEDKLERVILRVLQENSELHYYQGLHDVVLTFLLEVGEEMTYAIMSVILTCHIR